jgi:glutamate racemase
VTTQRTVGIVDWGIGGVGLLKRLDVRAPRLSVIYWSDTGTMPYGTQGTRDLRNRLRSIVTELAGRGCTEVVLACHSASTITPLLADCPIPVTGVIDHAVRGLPSDLTGPIGVVGGQRTISSGVYRRALNDRGLSSISRVAQSLSAYIEAGLMASVEFRSELKRIVAPIRGAQAIVLACTHYPAAAREFTAALPGTRLIDPADHAAAVIAESPSNADAPSRIFLTTGDIRGMQRAAQLAWDYRIDRVTHVRACGPLGRWSPP